MPRSDPRRPAVSDPRAHRLLEWADTLDYLAWRLLRITIAIVLIAHGASIDWLLP